MKKILEIIDNKMPTSYSDLEEIDISREKIMEMSYGIMNTTRDVLSIVGVSLVILTIWIGFLMVASVKLFLLVLFRGWQSCMDKLGRKRIIMDRECEEPYLERYYLFLQDRDEKFPFNIFLHKFLKSDPDNLHDHPWGFFTLILNGGYWEYIYEDNRRERVIKHWRGPGFWQKVEAKHTHRVVLQEGKGPCWTLFIPFKRERQWGFWKKMVDMTENEDHPKHSNQWIESDQYFLDKKKQKEKRQPPGHEESESESESESEYEQESASAAEWEVEHPKKNR